MQHPFLLIVCIYRYSMYIFLFLKKSKEGREGVRGEFATFRLYSPIYSFFFSSRI